MESKLSFFMDPQEWRQVLNELDFLVCQCYGDDLRKSHTQMMTQIPHLLAFLLSMIQFDIGPTELEAVKLIREGK